jgi:hypothetical protein
VPDCIGVEAAPDKGSGVNSFPLITPTRPPPPSGITPMCTHPAVGGEREPGHHLPAGHRHREPGLRQLASAGAQPKQEKRAGREGLVGVVPRLCVEHEGPVVRRGVTATTVPPAAGTTVSSAAPVEVAPVLAAEH